LQRSAEGAELLASYTEATARYEAFRDLLWPYAYFDDGTKIEQPHRLLYRRDVSMQAVYPNPFLSGPGTFQAYVRNNRQAVFDRYDESKYVRRRF
ncbi:MAG TPA: hypothetical protein VFE52_10985, partial [Devosia sp.]|nr:hypothetical protein [Devosia sp.]